MRMVLRDGHTEPRIDLVEATQVPHAYGIGALAELEGEITIFDGSVWVARSSGGDLAMSGPAVVESDRATLLTLSYVRQWESAELAEALTAHDFDSVIEMLVRARGWDTSNPFPFVIDGEVSRLESHVIAGSCPLSGAGGGAEPWHLSVDQSVQATLVGFFAGKRGGVLTHHGTSVHMHIIMVGDGRTITAHVEDVVVAAGSILRLPKK
jgi:alpha-acetolactate decarboxylase